MWPTTRPPRSSGLHCKWERYNLWCTVQTEGRGRGTHLPQTSTRPSSLQGRMDSIRKVSDEPFGRATRTLGKVRSQVICSGGQWYWKTLTVGPREVEGLEGHRRYWNRMANSLLSGAPEGSVCWYQCRSRIAMQEDVTSAGTRATGGGSA